MTQQLLLGEGEDARVTKLGGDHALWALVFLAYSTHHLSNMIMRMTVPCLDSGAYK